MKTRGKILYGWLGIGFIWIGAYALDHCYADCCPYALAAGISALVVWIIPSAVAKS